MSKIMKVIEVLGDGKWHGVKEMQLRLGLNEREVQEITVFLSKYTFVMVDEEHGKVKIERNFKKLLSLANF